MTPPMRRPGRPRNGEAELRRAQLLSDATTLFLQRGYHGVSLAQLATYGRVAVRTIYQEFGGKPGLLQAILQSEPDQGPQCALWPARGNDIASMLQGFAAEYWHAQACRHAQAWHQLRHEAASAGLISPIQNDDGFRARLAAYFASDAVGSQMRNDLPNDFLTCLFIACIGADCPPLKTSESSIQRVSIAARVALFLRAVRRNSFVGTQHFPI